MPNSVVFGGNAKPKSLWPTLDLEVIADSRALGLASMYAKEPWV